MLANMDLLSLPRLLFGRDPAAGPAPSGLRVRAMRPEDCAEILRIEASSFPDAWSAKTLDWFLSCPNTSGHVVPRGDACLAFFLVQRERDFLYLANLAVAPEARRTGLGSFCLRAVEKIAWAHGLARVVLDVRETNLAAQLLYRRCGYRAVEILRSYYGDADAYRMTKPVAGVGASRAASES
jgi:ribosomal-protein-alanine N-acetyltransferase